MPRSSRGAIEAHLAWKDGLREWGQPHLPALAIMLRNSFKPGQLYPKLLTKFTLMPLSNFGKPFRTIKSAGLLSCCHYGNPGKTQPCRDRLRQLWRHRKHHYGSFRDTGNIYDRYSQMLFTNSLRIFIHEKLDSPI